MLPTMFRCIWPSGFRGEDILEINQSETTQELPVVAILSTDQDEMNSLYRGASIDASYQVSVHFVKGFQRKRLKCEKLTDG